MSKDGTQDGATAASQPKLQLYCDICWGRPYKNGMTFQQCRVCRVGVHHECYGTPNHSSTKKQIHSFLCFACAAVGTTIEGIVIDRKYIETHSTVRTHARRSIQVTERPTECSFCSVDDGSDYYHAMHPVYHREGVGGKHIVLLPDQYHNAHRLAWGHTLCCMALCSHAVTRGTVYGCTIDGCYDGDDVPSENDFRGDDDDDSDRSLMSNTEDARTAVEARKQSKDDRIHHFVFCMKLQPNDKETEWIKRVRHCQSTLKCLICGSHDEYSFRLAVQCSAHDDYELKDFFASHTSLRTYETCFSAMHVGCAMWGRNDVGELPGSRRVFFLPGTPDPTKQRGKKPIYAEIVLHTYCALHAADLLRANIPGANILRYPSKSFIEATEEVSAPPTAPNPVLVRLGMVPKPPQPLMARRNIVGPLGKGPLKGRPPLSWEPPPAASQQVAPIAPRPVVPAAALGSATATRPKKTHGMEPPGPKKGEKPFNQRRQEPPTAKKGAQTGSRSAVSVAALPPGSATATHPKNTQVAEPPGPKKGEKPHNQRRQEPPASKKRAQTGSRPAVSAAALPPGSATANHPKIALGAEPPGPKKGEKPNIQRREQPPAAKKGAHIGSRPAVPVAALPPGSATAAYAKNSRCEESPGSKKREKPHNVSRPVVPAATTYPEDSHGSATDRVDRAIRIPAKTVRPNKKQWIVATNYRRTLEKQNHDNTGQQETLFQCIPPAAASEDHDEPPMAMEDDDEGPPVNMDDEEDDVGLTHDYSDMDISNASSVPCRPSLEVTNIVARFGSSSKDHVSKLEHQMVQTVCQEIYEQELQGQKHLDTIIQETKRRRRNEWTSRREDTSTSFPEMWKKVLEECLRSLPYYSLEGTNWTSNAGAAPMSNGSAPKNGVKNEPRTADPAAWTLQWETVEVVDWDVITSAEQEYLF